MNSLHLFLWILLLVCTVTAQHSHRAIHAEIMDLMNAGNYDEAVAVAKEDLERVPFDVPTWSLLAQCYGFQGDIPKAINETIDCLEILHADDGSYYNLGVLYWQIGAPEETLVAFARAILSNPDSANLYKMQALTAQRTMDRDLMCWSAEMSMRTCQNETCGEILGRLNEKGISSECEVSGRTMPPHGISIVEYQGNCSCGGPYSPLSAEAAAHYTIPSDYRRLGSRKVDECSMCFRRKLLAKQFAPEGCSARQLIFDTNASTDQKGMGSRFHYLALALHMSVLEETMLSVQPGAWAYADPERCPRRNHECYFHSISSCHNGYRCTNCSQWTPANALLGQWEELSRFPVGGGWWTHERLTQQRVHLMGLTLYEKYVRWAVDHEVPVQFVTEHVPYREVVAPVKGNAVWGADVPRLQPLQRLVPKEVQARGIFWYSSELTYFLLQPRQWVLDHVKWVRENALTGTFEHPILGMHVRHGDKWKEAPLINTARFLAKAVQFRHQFGVNRIFISTEDGSVIRELEALRDIHGFELVYTNNYPRPNINIQEGLLNGKLDGEAEALNALANLYIMMHCDYFIGTFSSNWSRLVLRMMYAHYGFLPPHSSLDRWHWDSFSPGLPGDWKYDDVGPEWMLRLLQLAQRPLTRPQPL
eukprot:Rmarinus@m.7320